VVVGKFILLLLLALVIWWLWRSRMRPPQEPSAPVAPPEEAMVACAHCGVYLPASESVGDELYRFCSSAHQLAGPRRDS